MQLLTFLSSSFVDRQVSCSFLWATGICQLSCMRSFGDMFYEQYTFDAELKGENMSRTGPSPLFRVAWRVYCLLSTVNSVLALYVVSCFRSCPVLVNPYKIRSTLSSPTVQPSGLPEDKYWAVENKNFSLTVHDIGMRYGGRKPTRGQGEPINIHKLLETFPFTAGAEASMSRSWTLGDCTAIAQ